MNVTRQDAWTEDEDIILAETVLRYIREGKTQLEAFKEVARKLSRTSAACGFRWNATIRKSYQDAIQLAKEERKQGSYRRNEIWKHQPDNLNNESETLDSAILLLEKMKSDFLTNNVITQQKEHLYKVSQLQKENTLLKEKLSDYENAWEEMSKLWHWVKEKNNE